MKFIWTIILITFVVSRPLDPQAVVKNSAPVSMLQLIATPEKFDGKTIGITGFFYLGRDEALLYLHQEDYNHALNANAIWFEPGEWVGKDLGKLQRKYVTLVGTFSAARKGPYGCPNGGLSVVDRFYFWSSPDNPEGLLRHMN